MPKISKTKALENKVLRYEQEMSQLANTLDQVTSFLIVLRKHLESQEYSCFNECQSLSLANARLIDSWIDLIALLEESGKDDE